MLRSQFLSGLGSSSVALSLPGTASSITIGVVGPLSGRARPLGQELVKGAQGAVDELNNYNITLSPGSQAYQIRTFDDQNTAADAVLQAQFATGDSTIVAVVGHLSGDTTIAAIPTYGNAQCPLVCPVSTDDNVTSTTYRNVFRLPTKDSTEGQLFGRAVAKQFKPKVPYIFVQDADYGADVANGFIQGMNEARIVTPYQQFSYDKPDFAAVVDKALLSQPDYVFLAGTVTDMGGIVPVLRAKNYTGPIGASQGFFDPGTIKLGSVANDMLISSSMPYLPFAPTSLRDRNDYEVHSGAMTPIAAFSYAAVQVIVGTMTRTGATARNTLLSAMHNPLPVTTIVGDFSFDGYGDPVDPQLYFYTVKDGKFSYVRQAHPSAFMIK